MDRFKEQLAKTVNQIGEQFSSDSDVKVGIFSRKMSNIKSTFQVLLDNMNEKVMSSYDAPSCSESPPIAPESNSQNSTPRRVKSKISEEDDVINSIDAAYFIDNDEFDAIDYELKV